MTEYPSWVCYPCGERHGKRPCNPHATWHTDTCDVCSADAYVTEPRDFGHLKRTWKGEK